MKKTLIFLSGFLFTISAFAQTHLDEVVYLKNGNIFRGEIIEQTPNEGLKIKDFSGNIFNVLLPDILKLTKEPSTRPEYFHKNTPPQETFAKRTLYTPHLKNGKLARPFYYKRQGYFNYTELNFQGLGASIRSVQGYKFKSGHYIGAGIGLDAYFFFPSYYNGVQIPLFLRYEADFLKRKITPYFETEIGWGFQVISDNGYNFPYNYYDGNYVEHTSHGGPLGSIGVGVKIFTKSKFNLKITPNFTWKMVRQSTFTDPAYPNVYYSGQPSVFHNFGGSFGLKIGFGF